jgi:hypothetical protein
MPTQSFTADSNPLLAAKIPLGLLGAVTGRKGLVEAKDVPPPTSPVLAMKRLSAKTHYHMYGVVWAGSIAGKEAKPNSGEVDIGCAQGCCPLETELAYRIYRTYGV